MKFKVKKLISFKYVVVVAMLFSPAVMASDDTVVAWWSFDEGEKDTVRDRVRQIEDVLEGSYKYTSGAIGTALKLDGYTTCIIRKAEDAPKLGDEFGDLPVRPIAVPGKTRLV